MKQPYLLVCFFCLFTLVIQAQVPKSTFFENSELPYGFSRTLTNYQDPAWIKNFHRKLPVSEAVFFTPPNSLELSYKSDSTGYWQADVYANSRRGFRVRESSYLHLKIFVQSKTSIDQLPNMRLIQADDHITEDLNLGRYISDYKTGKWISVKIKLSDFKQLDMDQPIYGVRFSQSQDRPDKLEHCLYMDQIELLPNRLPDSKLTGAAVLSSITSFERHVVLQWQLPLTPSIRYIQIYRSENNKDFVPIAIRTVPAMTYTDILPDASKTYYYKIAWVDYNYASSPFSAVKSAKSKAMTSDELLTMVQEAHIRYYLSGEEFNSGLQRLNRHLADVKVSTKGTGLGIMAMIIGVRHQMLSRDQLRRKVDKICDFLLESETFQGAFPAIINGKNGHYAGDDPIAGADLEATAYLIQGLLVARNYFDSASADEENLRKKITLLWRNVQWNKFKKEGEHYLYSSWTPIDGLAQAYPLSGQHSIPIYVMAMASPTHNIEIDDYMKGMARPMVFKQQKQHPVDSLSLLTQDSILSEKDRTTTGTWQLEPYQNGRFYCGIPLAVGHPDDALSKLLMAFVAFDPRNKSDAFANYFDNINHLAQIQSRQKAEQSSGFLTLTRGIPVSASASFSNQLDFNSEVALYGFNPEMGLSNLKRYYLDFTDLCWSDHGFKSRFDADKNQYLYIEDAAYKGLVPIMIENGRDGMIWNLFMKTPEIQTILISLYQ